MADDYQMPKGELMRGKRGIVTGVANHQSIAWGIASQLAAQGAEMGFLHLPGMERRVEPLRLRVHHREQRHVVSHQREQLEVARRIVIGVVQRRA